MLITFSACNSKQIKYEISGSNSSYTLTLDNFKYTIGITGINAVSGNFDELNKLVFKKLKGKNGICILSNKVDEKDYYGKKTSNTYKIGAINIDELNKFEDYKTWVNRTGGTVKLIRNL